MVDDNLHFAFWRFLTKRSRSGQGLATRSRPHIALEDLNTHEEFAVAYNLKSNMALKSVSCCKPPTLLASVPCEIARWSLWVHISSCFHEVVFLIRAPL